MNLNVTSVIAGVTAVAPARGSPGRRSRSRRTRRVRLVLIGRSLAAAATLLAIHLAVTEFRHVYFGRLNLPDLMESG